MKELITHNYDITDGVTSDNIKKLASFIQASSLSEAARKADIPSQLEMSKLADDKCALILFHPKMGHIRKYANYNKELTELNTLYFLDKAPHFPDEICKIAAHYLLKANKAFDIIPPENLEKLADNTVKSNIIDLTKIDPVAYQIKLARKNEDITKNSIEKLADDNFALPKKRKYPIADKQSVKTASAYFDAYYKDLEPTDRLAFAMNTKKAADKFNVEVADRVLKYANLDVECLNPELNLQIAARKELTVSKEAHKLYDDLLEKSAELGAVKVAVTLRRIDDLSNIKRHWDNFVDEPLVASLGLKKEASININGKDITKTALNKLCKKDISKWVNNYTVKEMQSEDGLAVFASLPQPTKEGLLSELDK